MSDQIRQLEEEVQRSQSQSDLAREAEQRMRETQDLPKYQYSTDGSMERDFTDKKGRDMTMRVEGADADTLAKWERDPSTIKFHECRIRVDEADAPPGMQGRGNVGHAEASLKPPGHAGNESTRLRLKYIETNPSEAGAGIGGQMIGEVEQLADNAGASEVYGEYSPETGREAEAKAFYESHGYQFRPSAGGGTEVYKPMGGTSDAQVLKQEARYRS